MNYKTLFQKFGWLAGLCLLVSLLAPADAAAQSGSTGLWQASYWNNITLSGPPDLVRTERSINNDWGGGSPAPGIDRDQFSARWATTVNLPAGEYRFSVTADDGVRLWIDGQMVIDAWHFQAATTHSAEIVSDGGELPITLEYFENTGLASVALNWERLDRFENRWQGEYFANMSLDGPPALIRPDPAVAFDWGSGSPAADLVGVDRFSARWLRTFDLPGGQYRFRLTADDGVRLWIDDTLLIDAWQPQAETTFEREIAIEDSQTTIRLEYFENGGLATVTLDWERLHPLPPRGASDLVDTGGAGFINGGPESDWQIEDEGFNSKLLWTRSSADVSGEYNWGRWYPTLTPGVYEVQAYIPHRFSTTAQARYWISHADGYTLQTIDQSDNGGLWVSLGTYEFEGSGSDFVSLADVTFEDDDRLVTYDAVRWLPINP